MNKRILSTTITGVLIAGACFSTPVSRAGENLFPGGNFEDADLDAQWATPLGASPSAEEARSGSTSLRFQSGGWNRSAEPLEIDPAKFYVLRAFVKEPKEKQGAEYHTPTVFLGLRLLDGSGEEISGFSVWPVVGTDATLSQPATRGATVLSVEGGQWAELPAGLSAIAFDVEEDLSDLPNLRVARVKSVSAGEGRFEVHLIEPLEVDYPAGTRVRQHKFADFPQVNIEPTEQWEELDLEIGGVSDPGIVEGGKFWHGTRSVKIVVGASIPAKGGMSADGIEFLVDDLAFERLD